MKQRMLRGPYGGLSTMCSTVALGKAQQISFNTQLFLATALKQPQADVQLEP